MTSDDLESHIIVNVSSTLTHSTIWFVAALCLIVDVRTDGRTDEVDFWQTLKSRDSITRTKLKNPAREILDILV